MEVGAEQAAGRFLEAQNLPQFGVEGLDNAVAGDGFMQNVLYLGKLVLPGAGALADGAANAARRSNHDRDKEQQCPTETASQRNDKGHGGKEGEELLQELADNGADRGLHFVHIVNERGKDGARGVLVKEAG